jgi:hypothetical protein
MTDNPTDQPIEHVEGQQPLPDAPPATPADDDSAPAPAPPGDVPYADEYAVPDVDEQAQLEAKVPDDPTPLTGDGEDEGDD